MTARTIFCLGLMFLSVPIRLFAEGQPPSQTAPTGVQIYQGQITAIDWVGGKIAVRAEYRARVDEKTFLVPAGLKIAKGTDTISLEDVNISDSVIIQYTTDIEGNLVVVTMIVVED